MGEPKKTDDTGGSSRAPAEHRRRFPLRPMLRITAMLGIVYVSVVVVLMFLEEQLIFFPSRYPQGDWDPPGLKFEDAHFTASDGVGLHGWFCPVDQPRAVVLVSHGNAGNITHRTEEIRLWQEQLQTTVFIYDYRGFGRSEGSPNELGVYADARAAYTWLTREKGVPADQVVLRGESIGSAVSLQLGLEVPHRALIMESPFTSAVAMGERSFPWFPVRWVMRNRFDSISKIDRYRGRLLITHGVRDSIVPFEMGRRLFERAAEPKQFYPIPHADHNDIPFTGGAEYFAAIRHFLDGGDAAERPDRAPEP